MGVVNKPDVSRIIVGFYVGMTVFVSVVFGVVFYFVYTEVPPNSVVAMAVLVPVIILVEGVMLWAVASIYRTRYVLTDTELVIAASRLIGGTKRIPLESIESAKRTLIPFGIKLVGASFHGGHYYIPSIGRAFIAITNFKDGILIKATNGNYVITPSNPENFIQESRKTRLEKQR
jgi:hypothetical protein